MSWARRDRAKFDRWSDAVERRTERHRRLTKWVRVVSARSDLVSLFRPDFAPPGARVVWWVSEPATFRMNNFITFTEVGTAVREENFVHPSWARPGPAPLTKRAKRGRPVPSTQLKRAARRYQQEHGVPYAAALRAVRERGQVQQKEWEAAPMKINTDEQQGGGQ